MSRPGSIPPSPVAGTACKMLHTARYHPPRITGGPSGRALQSGPGRAPDIHFAEAPARRDGGSAGQLWTPPPFIELQQQPRSTGDHLAVARRRGVPEGDRRRVVSAQALVELRRQPAGPLRRRVWLLARVACGERPPSGPGHAALGLELGHERDVHGAAPAALSWRELLRAAFRAGSDQVSPIARSGTGLSRVTEGPHCSGSMAEVRVILGAEVFGSEGQWLVCD